MTPHEIFKAALDASRGKSSTIHYYAGRRPLDELRLDDETVARRTDWTTLAERLHRRMQSQGYSGEDITIPLGELFSTLAQYHEVSAIGITYHHGRNRPVMDIWLLTGLINEEDSLQQTMAQRAGEPVNAFSQRMWDSIDSGPKFFMQQTPTLRGFRAELETGLALNKTDVLVCFPTPLANNPL